VEGDIKKLSETILAASGAAPPKSRPFPELSLISVASRMHN
jgi:hypothetical protein